MPLGILKILTLTTVIASNVVTQPANAFTVPLSHHNRAHEDLDRSNILKIDLTLASGLVYAEDIS
jgi:hypothetical protein